MKTGKLVSIGILIQYLGSFISWAAIIWAFISFVVYLVKDRPFDWRSVWLFTAGMILTVGIYIVGLIWAARARRKIIKSLNKHKTR